MLYTVAGSWDWMNLGDDSLAIDCGLRNAEFVTISHKGEMLISDRGHFRIRKVDTFGIITTIAGTDSMGYSGDGGLAKNAIIGQPAGIAVDRYDNIYFAAFDYNVIRKIDTSGIITTVVGTGIKGYSGDGGLAKNAELYYPVGLHFDNFDNLYIADDGNHVIRKVSPSGIISTIAGNGTSGFSGDGGIATDAQLNLPTGVTTDQFGNVYIADYFNHRIRKVNTSGIISTIAGNGFLGYSGDAGAAAITSSVEAYQVETDGAGNIYTGEAWNHVVRKIDEFGIISTVTGNGTEDFYGDSLLAIKGAVYLPCGIAFDKKGNLYIADALNDRIRMVTNAGVPKTSIHRVAAQKLSFSIFPNPSNGNFTITSSGRQLRAATIHISDMAGRHLWKQQTTPNNNSYIIKANLPSGIYILEIIDLENNSSKQLLQIN